MAKHPEEELIGYLCKLVTLWRLSQYGDRESMALVGAPAGDEHPDEIYVVDTMPYPMASPLAPPIQCPLSVVETLIRMGYLRPTDGPGTLTFLHPTVDALFLRDGGIGSLYRAMFRQRYERFRLDPE